MNADRFAEADLPEDAEGPYATVDWLAESAEISEERAKSALEGLVEDGVFSRDPEPGKYRPGSVLQLTLGYARYKAELRGGEFYDRFRGGSDVDESDADSEQR